VVREVTRPFGVHHRIPLLSGGAIFGMEWASTDALEAASIDGRATRCQPGQPLASCFERSDVLANHFHNVSSASVEDGASGIQSHTYDRF